MVIIYMRKTYELHTLNGTMHGTETKYFQVVMTIINQTVLSNTRSLPHACNRSSIQSMVHGIVYNYEGLCV